MRQFQIDQTDIREKVDAMHDLLMKAKGVRWVILALVGVGAFLAGLAERLVFFRLIPAQ